MLYQQLKQIRGLLRRREIKLSDALLIVLRYLRNRLPSERLIWLNRELLGYCKDDLPSLYERPRFHQQLPFFKFERTVELDVPQYRFLTGCWGRLDTDGQLIKVKAPHLSDENIFCNIGIQQIETQLEEVENPNLSMFSMSTDDLTGAEFYCWSQELVRVYDAVRQKLCQFIETVIEELKLLSNER